MKNGPYTLVVSPSEYPGKKYRDRYVYEHHLIWWKNTGIILPDGYNIHHKNENPRDNRFSNLELIHKSTHSKIHNNNAGNNKWVALICEYCKKPFQRLKRQVLYKKTSGQDRFYCCRSHQVKNQRNVMTGQKSWIELICPFCEKSFLKMRSQVVSKKKCGQLNFYCSRSCHGKSRIDNLYRIKGYGIIYDYETGLIPT